MRLHARFERSSYNVRASAATLYSVRPGDIVCGLMKHYKDGQVMIFEYAVSAYDLFLDSLTNKLLTSNRNNNRYCIAII